MAHAVHHPIAGPSITSDGVPVGAIKLAFHHLIRYRSQHSHGNDQRSEKTLEGFEG